MPPQDAETGKVAANNIAPPLDPKHLIPLQLDDALPNNVSTHEQLALLPDEVLSGDKSRPLLHVDDAGEEYHYALRPMFYSVIFILFVELLERFSFYGINYTQTSYLTGAYNPDWNAGYSSIGASSYVSISTAIAYTSPFLGAILADSFLGDYNTILFGSLLFYVPGLMLIALTTIPNLLGETFNTSFLAMGLLCLWPIGTGMVKSVVNVFGAKQHHPVLQSALIETYYVNFYMCINIGALAGGIVIPIVAQSNVTAAYFIPVAMLSMGVVCFFAGTRRYVKHKPRGDMFQSAPPCCTSTDSDDEPSMGLDIVARVSTLVVPFCIAYSQMATTFIVQGTVMKKALGYIDAASMNNADAIAVLFFGYVVGNVLYPELAKRDIKIPTSYKFAFGSALGAMAIGWALVVEYKIHRTFEATGERISVLWQAPAYMLIGCGEIFAVSAAYEVAFTAAPPSQKGLASAANLFFIGGLPNVLCIGLYHACQHWFENSQGRAHISTLEDYTEAHIAKYFWVLFGIALSGVVINVLPSIKNWLESVEDQAAELVKTPKPTPKIGKHLSKKKQELGGVGKGILLVNEKEPLMKTKKHQDYLKYGSGPVLYKHGSMRAGPTLAKKKQKTIKAKAWHFVEKLLTPRGTPKGTPRTSPKMATHNEAEEG